MKWSAVYMSLSGILLLLAAGCSGPMMKIRHEVEPIYVTVDVNIKVQRELDDFFGFEDKFLENEQKEAGDEAPQ
jgi:hypothetical protein